MLPFLPLPGNLAGRKTLGEIPMTAKTWTTSEIRALARQTVDGKKAIATARGAYFRALIETTQAELGTGKSDQAAQLSALKSVHRKFYPVVQEATLTDDIAPNSKLAAPERKRRANERNKRTNFARTAYGTVRRWLRSPTHDLMKLDAKTTTKSQLLKDAPPTRPHALTAERIQRKVHKLVGGVSDFARQVAKADQTAAISVLKDAIERLQKQLGAYTGRRRSAESGRTFERRLAA